MSELLSTIRARIDADLAAATTRTAIATRRLTQAQGIESGLQFVKEAMDRFDAGVYPTDEDAAPSEPLDPPATRGEILYQLRRHPPGFTSVELQARLALSGPVVDGHLHALRKEGAVRHTIVSPRVWTARSVESETVTTRWALLSADERAPYLDGSRQ